MSRTGAVAIVLFSLTALLLAATAGQCGAQYFGAVTIKADGTVAPADSPIQRVGDTYTLTGEVGSISVQRSNIILDGNGSALSGSIPSATVFLDKVKNVTVTNLVIKGGGYGIYLERCSNVTVSGNTITGTHVPVPGLQATGGIFVWEGNSNTITGNQLTNNYEAIYIGYDSQAQQNVVTRNHIENSSYGIIMGSVNNNIYQNNFVNNTVQVYLYGEIMNFWDNGSVGNFWSDYDGTDADGDGIGDTPYVIDENNQDSYPLTTPYQEPEPTPEPQKPEPLQTTLVIASIATVAVIAASLLIAFKKRKR